MNREHMKDSRNFVLVLVLCLLPLHAFSAPRVISEDITLQKLKENVWLHTSYIDYPGYGRISANGLIVIDGTSAAMIDTPWNDEQTGQLFDWVNKELNANIEHVIVGHSHDDCMGGLAEAHRRGAISYALDTTQEKATQEGLPIPQKTFSDSMTLTVGKTDFELRYFGGGHTVDNITVWLPGQKVLFGGCMVKTTGAKGLGNTKEADLDAWPGSLRKLFDAYPEAEIVIPGHGPQGGRELIEHTINLLSKRRS